MSKQADAGGQAETRDATFLELSEPLRAVWMSVYAVSLGGDLASRSHPDSQYPNDNTAGSWAERHAWEAVRRANGGKIPQTVIATRPVSS